MARATASKTYRTLAKGFVTEATELSYPENSISAGANCLIYKKGNSLRRFGFDYETGPVLSTITLPVANLADYAIKEFTWTSVALNGNLNFLVMQVGLNVYFYDLANNSAGFKSFSIDLTPYIAPTYTTTTAKLCELTFTSGNGYLFAVGEQFKPFLVSYDSATDAITKTQFDILIRDFKGCDDGLTNDTEPSTLSKEHEYNLMNQGWLDAVNDGSGPSVSEYDFFGRLQTGVKRAPYVLTITNYYSNLVPHRYPPNNKIWWIGKDANKNFDPNVLNKTFFGNNRAPRGHFILNAFNKDRTAMSGVASIAVETTNEYPNSVAFFSGRTWYGAGTDIYFCQILDDKRRAGLCYQEADPTSENISDLIATDGGVIPIPELGKCIALIPSGSGILVFGTNGVWIITGTSQGFSALDYSVAKVSETGTDSPNSIVQANGMTFYWTKTGIQAFQQKNGLFGPVDGLYDQTNITLDSIQTFYNETVSDTARPYVKGTYESATNIIQWLYGDTDDPTNYTYSNVLTYDVSLGAFYPPWTISASGPKVVGAFVTPTLNDTPGNEVRLTRSKYAVIVPVSTSYKLTFGHFNNDNFADWETYDGTGVAYTSYIVTGYELLDDTMRNKEIDYLFTYFKRTEDTYVDAGDGSYTLSNESSCTLQVRWDWASSAVSGKWSSPVQAYRLTRLPPPNELDLTLDTGYPIAVSRNRIRGHGRAIQFKFECSDIGKNFNLLGWAVQYSGNKSP